MATRTAKANWNGSLREGGGTVALGTGALEAPFSFQSRFEEGSGTNPDELLAASLAGCYAMQLSGVLGEGGHEPETLEADAEVHLHQGDDGLSIARIDLAVRGRVPGIDQAEFTQNAQTAKELCAVHRALAGVGEITLDAQLEG
jgi:lipoyl-dependent peroxiredoxin